MTIEVDNAQRIWEEAVWTTQRRRMSDHWGKQMMAQVADRVNGDVHIPLPTVKGRPNAPVMAAQILADAIDGFATRAADAVMIPLSAPFRSGEAEAARALLREQIAGARFTDSQLDWLLGRPLRQYRGYGTYCLHTFYNKREDRAQIQARNPMFAYPDFMEPEEIRRPENIGYVYGRSAGWVKWRYSHEPRVLRIIDKSSSSNDEVWDILEWWDRNVWMVGIMGRRDASLHRANMTSYKTARASQSLDQAVLIDAFPNRAEMVPSVLPQVMTLDRVQSRLVRILPHVDMLEKITALDFIAKQKETFPSLYMVGENGRTPKLIGTKWRRGETGEINMLSDVREVGQINTVPGGGNQILKSELERAARFGAGDPAILQGELTGAVRSGTTASTLAGFSVDPDVKEAHTSLQYALAITAENVAAIERGYIGSRRVFAFNGWNGREENFSYIPAEVFRDTIRYRVIFPMPGMDTINATAAITNLLRIGLMSKHTARQRHPIIPDGEFEERTQAKEMIEEGMLQGIAQRLLAPPGDPNAIPLEAAGLLAQLLGEGMNIAEAWEEANRRFAERQADEAPELDAIEAQPGLEGAAAILPGAGTTPTPAAGNPGPIELLQALGAVPPAAPSPSPGAPPSVPAQLPVPQ